jgi:hypothetical protein
MVWSVSTAKIFDRCQRQWFFKQHFANARSKDEARRKAYLLGKLQSVSSWRGSVVDQVLSFEVIAALGRDETVSEAESCEFRLCEKLGITLRWHDMRHFAVSLWIEQGFSIKEVMTFAGHDSVLGQEATWRSSHANW